jgi:hypothetical protein
MKPANCKICGKVFLKSSFDICPDCVKKEQELIRNINDYCFNKEVVTLEEIGKEFNEPMKKLEKFLLDRKLVQIMDKLEMTCKACGIKYRILNEGRLYCKICYDKLETELARSGFEQNKDPYSKY